MRERGGHPGRPVKGQANWHMAGELLKAGQYDRLAELLHEARIASEQAGDAILAHILDAARQICLACSQYRTETEWHRRAYEEADQREHELKQQLHTMLDLISGRKAPETPEKQEGPPHAPAVETSSSECGLPKPLERLSLWQRIQTLLGRGPGLRPPRRGAPIVSTEARAAPLFVERQKQGATSLAVYCLGPFRVYQNDQLIMDWDSLKARSILKYLVGHRGAPVAKDILMDVFWPDADPEVARRNLHQAIYSLRQMLRRERPDFQHIQFADDCYLLSPEMDIWLDCEEFEKHTQAGRHLEAAGQLAEAVAEYGIAEGLYQGDFLEEDLYEDWPRMQREHIRATYLDIADRLSKYYVQQAEYTAAIALCQKVLARDNCHEEAHRRLMQCYVAQGQRHLAVRQYQICVQALREELDLTPSEETVALYRHITTHGAA